MREQRCNSLPSLVHRWGEPRLEASSPAVQVTSSSSGDYLTLMFTGLEASLDADSDAQRVSCLATIEVPVEAADDVTVHGFSQALRGEYRAVGDARVLIVA